MNILFVILIVSLAILAVYDYIFSRAPKEPDWMTQLDRELKRRGQ